MIKCCNYFIFILTFLSPLYAEETLKEQPAATFKEDVSETTHTAKINGVELSYKATAGNLILKDESGKAKASIFYVAYTKQNENNLVQRPITFCFNGGPGSSSVWLHLGVFGPRRLGFEEGGTPAPPYQLTDNDYSILDMTDLVFIDPVSTGYSRAAPGEDPKQFYGVEEDVKSIAHFVRLFLTRQDRWESPKYLAGESYGTTRAAALAKHLHEESHLYINGVILISSILNFQTLTDPQGGNDLPYISFLPTYTAIAWYYKKLPEDLQRLGLQKAMQEAEKFAMNEYNWALMQGDNLDAQKKQEIVQKLARYTGLSPSYIDKSNIRINNIRFAKELLRNEKRTVGRFDTRYQGMDYDAAGECFDYDPSFEALIGPFSGAFNYYVRNELKWKDDAEYKCLAQVTPWNYSKASNQFLHVGESLREVMTKNPTLKVFVGSGYYDLATPYFGTDYTFGHLNLDPSLRNNVKKYYYEGGHMMYTHLPSLIKLKQDLANFFSLRTK